MSIKVGDKIRVTRSTWDIEVGVHEVTFVSYSGIPAVANKSGYNMFIQDESTYELVEEKEMNQFKAGDLVVSNEYCDDIVKGTVYEVVAVQGNCIDFYDDGGDYRQRLAKNYTLHVPEPKRVTLADVDPVELAEAFYKQSCETYGAIEHRSLLQGAEKEVQSIYPDGDFTDSADECIHKTLFKYLTLTNTEEFSEPKELVKGKRYTVEGEAMYFLGLDSDGSHMFSYRGLTKALAEGLHYSEYIDAQETYIYFLTKEEALELQEA